MKGVPVSEAFVRSKPLRHCSLLFTRLDCAINTSTDGQFTNNIIRVLDKMKSCRALRVCEVTSARIAFILANDTMTKQPLNLRIRRYSKCYACKVKRRQTDPREGSESSALDDPPVMTDTHNTPMSTALFIVTAVPQPARIGASPAS